MDHGEGAVLKIVVQREAERERQAGGNESAFGGPEPPMRWADHNPFTAGSLGPAARSTPAGEDQWMHPIPVDHRELEVALVGRG